MKKNGVLIESAGWHQPGGYWTETCVYYANTQQVSVTIACNGVAVNNAWFPAVVFGWEGVE